MPYLWLPQTREFVPMPRGFVPSSTSSSSSSSSSSSTMSTLMNSGKNPPHIESTSVSGKGNHQHLGQSTLHTTPFSTLAGGIFPMGQRDLVTLCHVIGPKGVRILDEEITTMIHHLSTTIIETFLITNQMLLKELRQDVYKGLMWNPVPLISSMQLATASMKVQYHHPITLSPCHIINLSPPLPLTHPLTQPPTHPPITTTIIIITITLI